MRFLVGLLLGWGLLLPDGWAQVDTLRSLSPDRRLLAICRETLRWHIMTTHARNSFADSTTAIRWLDSVRTLALEQQDERLFWYATLQQFVSRVVAEKRLHKPITMLRAAEGRMAQCPVPAVRGTYYIYYGEWLLHQGKLEEALRWLFRARNLFEEIGYDHIPEAHQYLSTLGSIYYSFSDYRRSVQYYEQAQRYPNPGLAVDYTNWNTLGMAYLRLEQYKLAEQAFRQVIRRAKAAGDTAYEGIGYGNLGNTLRLSGKPREALPYLYKEVALNYRRVPESAAQTSLYIAKALLALDSTEKAWRYLAHPNRALLGVRWSNYPLDYFEVMALYYRKMGDLEQGARFIDSAVVLKDSMLAVRTSTLLTTADNTQKAEKYLNNLSRIETEKQWGITTRNIVILALLLIGALVLYAIRQKQRRLEQERTLLAEQRRQAEAELAHAQVQLVQYVRSLSAKNQLVEQMMNELALARQHLADPLPSQSDSIRTLLTSVILTDKDWLQFRQLFEQAHPGFLQQLRQTYGELSPAEVRLLTLLKLEVPTKQMAFMLGVSPDSIHKSRYRLRKKLGSLGDTYLQGLFEAS
ncbi:hypothetical protein FAES_3106 [Fibrella aestuarina BUZ 2]|uniref:Tetratricopeptide repeat protein n=1 Tax=Fibrella aestuarina BUZ 2 TaxID=1166018 RepID=I0KAG2_9BACT|nr:tetratricopeptide repeat protein [Fibrella aestuarina]CCH01115.1 hypothetical protein FAES_3106 [Fibrella aestuarina BUZ 2]